MVVLTAVVQCMTLFPDILLPGLVFQRIPWQVSIRPWSHYPRESWNRFFHSENASDVFCPDYTRLLRNRFLWDVTQRCVTSQKWLRRRLWLHRRNWKQRFQSCFPSTLKDSLRRQNLKTQQMQSSVNSFWICVWTKLRQENHKASFSTCFPSTLTEVEPAILNSSSLKASSKSPVFVTD